MCTAQGEQKFVGAAIMGDDVQLYNIGRRAPERIYPESLGASLKAEAWLEQHFCFVRCHCHVNIEVCRRMCMYKSPHAMANPQPVRQFLASVINVGATMMEE
jgi:hypothetical protein